MNNPPEVAGRDIHGYLQGMDCYYKTHMQVSKTIEYFECLDGLRVHVMHVGISEQDIWMRYILARLTCSSPLPHLGNIISMESLKSDE